MTEHFENLWERAEKVSEEYFNNKNLEIYDVIAELHENLVFLRMAIKNNDKGGNPDIIGNILFNITFLSKKLNINTYAVLNEHIKDIKLENAWLDLDNGIE